LARYGLKVSELDVTVYDDYATGSFVASPEVPYTPELSAAQAERFAELFSVYRQNKGSIRSVTFWGLTDDRSWLNYQPVFGRADYPLLYKDANTAKPARLAIMNF
jgi:endo-1,4-beta-xylanase